MIDHAVGAKTRRHFFKVAAAAAGFVPFIRTSASASSCGTFDTCPVCFLLGTRILTATGSVAIEQIEIGDRVKTRKGAFRPVKWIGRQRFKNATQLPDSFLPICIARRALDGCTPSADLYVSPSHCLFLDGGLIPAEHLVNGTTIVRALPDGMKDIEYFHIELETHEVIFAEGAPAETLFVTNDRKQFGNSVEYERLYGSHQRSMIPYAPIVRYNGGRSELKALARRMVEPLCDVRDPIQVAFDRIAALAATMPPHGTGHLSMQAICSE